MKNLVEFFKTATAGGLFILLPIMLFYLIFSEIMEMAVVLATPIADLFPPGTFDETKAAWFFAILLIVGTSFLLGILVKLGLGRSLGRWLEDNLLMPLPGYRAIKELTTALASPAADKFQPALIALGKDQKDLGYLIEEHGNGLATVMLPFSPTPLAGSLRIVPASHIECVDIELGEWTAIISYWGFGLTKALERAQSKSQ
jgi:uncharacterized membrane protein